MIFFVILFGVPLLTVGWLVFVWRELAQASPSIRSWRWAAAAFAGFQLAVYLWLILSRILAVEDRVPIPLLSAAYIWHLVLAPITMVSVGIFLSARLGSHGLRWIAARMQRPSPAPAAPAADQAAPAAESLPEPPSPIDEMILGRELSRRQTLGLAFASAPLVLTGASTLRGVTQLDSFRVRTIEVPIPSLPAELDGFRIANISDVHVGKFSHGGFLRSLADGANNLRPDLTVLTGDLIDHSIRDLPEAIDFVKRLDARRGVILCEGNHDLFQGRKAFGDGVRQAGLDLLVNEARSVEHNGRRINVVGLQWGRDGAGRAALLQDNVAEAARLTDPEAVNVLLAHHPHAFDHAKSAGFDLVMSGHTHGGQLMLAEDVGPGPMMYKYWSGLYLDCNSALTVSNGAGNWFPLRLNAPAEILVTVLRRSTASA